MFGSADGRLGNTELAGLIAALGDLAPAADDAARVDRIRLLERLHSAVAAAALSVTAEFAESQRAAQRSAGTPAERVGRGIASQVALAKRISPYQAQRYVGAATILTAELPHTFAALAAGGTSPWRAMIVARETAWLSRAHRAAVDQQLAPRLEHLGDRAVEREVKALAYRLDPHGFLDRIKAAEQDRRVGLRPAPDTMARLTGLLPVAQGVAAYAALKRQADSLIAQGDARSRGQIMADTLVERLTGQQSAADVPVEVGLIMTDRCLLDGDPEPAVLDGYGPIPAQRARELVTGPSRRTPIWLRRLYTHPKSGQLVAMDSTRRYFAGGQRRFVEKRDQHCRTPWCGAPIRHLDHVHAAGAGGSTSTENAQGYCEACNYARQAPGWSARVIPTEGVHVVELRTPTGHRYLSRPPDPPGRNPGLSPVERRLEELLRAAA